MTRMMFSEVTKSWNPYVGCCHNCVYCWARDNAEGRLAHLDRYRDGFTPKLVEKELRKHFSKGFIFTCSMGDLWGGWVDRRDILAVLEVIKRSPNATFLLLTKNPARYQEFLDLMPPNVVLGASVETDLWDKAISSAPAPLDRIGAMREIPNSFRKMISVEPILKFTPEFYYLLAAVEPEFVYIGYDNHNNNLPEPTLEDTNKLIALLEGQTEVRKKTIRKAWWER